MRLIDADELMRDVLFRCNQEIVKYKTMRHALGNVGRAAFDAVKAAPTIDAEPVRHRQWIGLEYDGFADGCPVYDLWECSACGYERKGEDTPNYCPNCGAKMMEVQ